MGIYADAELMLYESGIFRALDRDFWRRTAGRTHPSYDPLTCHSGCAPPPKLDWQQVNHAVLLVGYGTSDDSDDGLPYWIVKNRYQWAIGLSVTHSFTQCLASPIRHPFF